EIRGERAQRRHLCFFGRDFESALTDEVGLPFPPHQHREPTLGHPARGAYASKRTFASALHQSSVGVTDEEDVLFLAGNLQSMDAKLIKKPEVPLHYIL